MSYQIGVYNTVEGSSSGAPWRMWPVPMTRRHLYILCTAVAELAIATATYVVGFPGHWIHKNKIYIYKVNGDDVGDDCSKHR